MPQLGFGTWKLPDAQAPLVVRGALDTGYRLIDTAAIYRNERGVGEGLAGVAAIDKHAFDQFQIWLAAVHGRQRAVAVDRLVPEEERLRVLHQHLRVAALREPGPVLLALAHERLTADEAAGLVERAGEREPGLDRVERPAVEQVRDVDRVAGRADVGLIIHEGQLTYRDQGLELCQDLGIWWGEANDGLPLPLGGNVIHKHFAPAVRKQISDILTASIQYSLDHRPEAVAHSLQWARDMGMELADRFVGMYVNHWTLDYGEKGRESIRRFLARGQAMGVIPKAPPLEFVV